MQSGFEEHNSWVQGEADEGFEDTGFEDAGFAPLSHEPEAPAAGGVVANSDTFNQFGYFPRKETN